MSRSTRFTSTDANADASAPDRPNANANANADDATDGPRSGAAGRREVVVPLRLYKTVTVFSTLVAVGAVLSGFVVLDRATESAGAAPSDVNVALALLGVAAIALGAATYAFSTRFRTDGMAPEGADGGDRGG
ncbi:DUF7315 family membrane protein [Salinilacihabitans rarus]|uniref:DUF7315 family membrane protein n=1 Tax=Salinilacihabitans rarus TaxID=2961596 RepID=UPI0020C84C68|nr:hypothetical protein [Salinilacihabitans rarus]